MAGPASARRRAYGLESGDRIGRYVIVAPLAMGGMAELYVAHPEGHAHADAYVVIKRTLPHLAQDAEFASMFLKEARLASALDHPNIAKVLEAGEDDGDFYIVLEYVHGYDLRALIRASARSGTALPLEVSLGIGVQLCAGLHCAHDQTDANGRPLQLVHRDVTPSNVLLDHDGRVLLTDFGIARALTTMRTTRAGVIKGKLGYMSPEQCRDGHLDRRSDVFSVGVLLYEMTTGFRMFHAGNDFAILNKIAKGEFTPPSEAVEGFPEALEAIIVRCVSVEASERFVSADALGTALRDLARQRGLALTAAARAEAIESALGHKALPEIPAEVRRSSTGSAVTRPEAASGGDGETATVVTGERRRRPWAIVAALALGGVAGGTAVMASRASEPPAAAPERVASPTPAKAVAPAVADPDPEPDPKSEPKPEPEPTPRDSEPVDVSPQPPAAIAPSTPTTPPRARKKKKAKSGPSKPPKADPTRKILPPSMQRHPKQSKKAAGDDGSAGEP
ncbi:MAG: protein kinase [Myxococcota bacterium]